MSSTSSFDLKMSFQTDQSPPSADYSNAEAMPAIRDAESSVAETGGNQSLYNPEVFGSLRKGEILDFFSMDCVGLVAATFASVFSLVSLDNLMEPMLVDNFQLERGVLKASHRITSIPAAFCFFFGLLSDSYPIFGFRRKGYLIMGLSITVVSFLIISGLGAYADTFDKGDADIRVAVSIIAIATLANIGNMFTFMCVRTRVIELAQREPLGMRGAIVATYSIFRFFICILTNLIAYTITTTISAKPYVSISIFGLIIASTIPLVWKAWQEKYYSLSTPMKTRGQILWKVMQQKAVWHILVFLSCYILFTTISFDSPVATLATWAGVSNDNVFLEQMLSYGMILVTIVVWRYYLLNRSWRIFFASSIVLLIVPQVIVAICVTEDLLRDPHFYRFMSIFPSMAAGVNWIACLIPLTEIVQEGSEGAMVGLMLSLQSLVDSFVNSNVIGLFAGSSFYDPLEVALDTSKARTEVLQTLLLNYGINALAFLGLYFLPRQKLDTQQLRSYGGYTKSASAAIVGLAVVLFVYSLIVTALALNPSTSCLRVAGGDGC
ncbi:hypothetical protein PsorP6_009768 [Peronosclerospora sorghi]|uniref:Uncharacterized protein n=1 Tax=Peronosclerospora sorghi TaxID=230839 RepID=A0ACC0W0D4_9STRA|nr:hypothetical protein PsorP6_009768 [Peronosclerospora sorghi]